MSSMDWLSYTCGYSNSRLTKSNRQLLDHYMFMMVCLDVCRHVCLYKEPIQLLANDKLGADLMFEQEFMSTIVQDILHSEVYTLEGIAYYSNTDVDVIYEIALGRNNNPSLSLSKKLIALHREVRPELYQAVIEQWLSSAAKES